MENHRTPTKPALEISLALGGGAARGGFHLGFIQALQENEVSIKAISGTSAGALVGGAIACGKKPHELLEIFCSSEFRDIFSWNWFNKSLFRINSSAMILNKIFPYKDLSQTQIPFFCCVTDMKTMSTHYLNSGDAHSLISASCALVPLFEPIATEGTLFADGGYIDLLPTTPLVPLAYPICALNLFANQMSTKLTLKKLTQRAWQILWLHSLTRSKQDATWFVESPRLNACKVFSLKDIQKSYEIGYQNGLEWCKKQQANK